jgi:NYN domain-containing protein
MPTQDRSYVRTALFVDFDNVYSNLNAIDPAAGEAFATDPDRWLRWMQEDMGQVVRDVSDEASREILVRACYLNPVMFGKFRPFFTRAAFRVIDCPPLTSRGKNSADIYMVLDILDALTHPTNFDEFILLSADADFTPVMLRLRSHDRRTVLLATGPSAMALRSACDMVLPLEVFLSEALEIDLEQGGEAQPVTPGPVALRPVAPVLAVEGTQTRLRERMQAVLAGVMNSAQAPVPMAAAAQRIRDQIGDVVLRSEWAGYGTFRAFVQAVTSDTLRTSGPYPPGYLVDPRRHEPLEPEEPRVPLPPGVAGLARRVARIVGVPQLTTESYRTLFEEIARISANGAANGPLSTLEPLLRDACSACGGRVPRWAIHFVLIGLRQAGADWKQTPMKADALAEAFADNVVRLCENARMELAEDETARLRSWIAGP